MIANDSLTVRQQRIEACQRRQDGIRNRERLIEVRHERAVFETDLCILTGRRLNGLLPGEESILTLIPVGR
jgi:hypothetical protein